MKASLFKILFFFCMVNHMAAQDFASRFEQIVQKIVDEDYWPFSLIRDMNAVNLPDSLIPLLRQYQTFPDANVQHIIHRCYYEHAIVSKDTLFMRRMMNYMLDACAHIDSTELSYACSYVTVLLCKFGNDLFDQSMINIINERANTLKFYYLDYAYLSGKLYQYQMIPVFEEMILTAKWEETKLKWHIILSRLGHKQSIDIMVETFKKMSMKSRQEDRNTFFYIRQKPVIDILFDDLVSKETIRYELIHGDRTKTPLAYETMQILIKLVKDFPGWQDGLSESECLKIARAWAKKHRNDYEIIEE